MAQRSRIGSDRSLIDRITRLPWWLALALAAACWLLLQQQAAGSQLWPLLSEPARLARRLAQAPWKTLAGLTQYLLAFFFVATAAVSALRRWRRQWLLARIAHSDSADALDRLSWRQFELLVGEVFRRQGHRVAETGGGGADGGVDLVLRKGGRQWLVQCKHWKAQSVGVAVVRELYGVIAASGAAGGFVVTSGRFTAQAVDFSQGLALTLIDGARLCELARRGRAAAAPASARGAAAGRGQRCPLCARPMVRRGANTGREFWSCSRYPRCRGTRPMQ